MKWYGVMPAITTCLDENLKVDHRFATRHAQWLLTTDVLGSSRSVPSGKAATLTFAEKEEILRNLVAAETVAP